MRQDKWFSIIVALSMMIVALINLFVPMNYIKHIADVIVLPLFFLTVLETIGHIKNSIYLYFEIKIEQIERDEKWLRRDYNIIMQNNLADSKNVKEQYEELITQIVVLKEARKIINKWFRFYKWIYILFGVILITAALLANIDIMVYIESKINATTVTLLTFVLFASETWLVDIFAYKISKEAEWKVYSVCGRESLEYKIRRLCEDLNKSN